MCPRYTNTYGKKGKAGIVGVSMAAGFLGLRRMSS